MQPTMLAPVRPPDFEYRMKRWWSWALYAFSVYATGHLVFLLYQATKMANAIAGQASAAVETQLVLGAPIGFMMVMPFVSAAFACVALICIYRLSGKQFEKTTIWSAWSIVGVVAVVMGGSIFTIEAAANAKSQSEAAIGHETRVEYINQFLMEIPPGTSNRDFWNAIDRSSGRASIANPATKIDYDKGTGLPATKWEIDLFRAGRIDVYLDNLTGKVIRTEIAYVLD